MGIFRSRSSVPSLEQNAYRNVIPQPDWTVGSLPPALERHQHPESQATRAWHLSQQTTACATLGKSKPNPSHTFLCPGVHSPEDGIMR